MRIQINVTIDKAFHFIKIFTQGHLIIWDYWFRTRTIFFLNTLLNTNKFFVIVVFPFKHIVSGIDFFNLCHYFIHVMNFFFCFFYICRNKTLFTEERTELISKDYILFFFLVKVAFKLTLYSFELFFKVIDYNCKFFWNSFYKAKVNFTQSKVNDSAYIIFMVITFKHIDAFNTMCYFCD